MTIEFIDHALNVVLTGILYGSEAWIVAAFGLYVATHKRPVTSSAFATIDIDAVETQFTTRKAVEVTSRIELPTPILSYSAASEIVCEPVNWKVWKVSDLRKADIAETCRVRTHSIGSSRKLSKADLIAQYEQQLKRFAKLPATDSAKQKILKGERNLA